MKSSRARAVALVVGVLLGIQVVMLAWIGSRKSPGLDEPGHLVAGLSHWSFGQFELYRANPPLIRVIATLPLCVIQPQMDWSSYSESPYARPEFSLGAAFMAANGFDSFGYFTLCRWCCIPIVLLGGLICFLWARDLYGEQAGFSALVLWVFCPNILGNGALITPDVGAATFGAAAGYTFWRWLRAPTWKNAILAGVALGLAELTKSTWIILFGLWPMTWFFWRLVSARDCGRRRVDDNPQSRPAAIVREARPTLAPTLTGLALVLLLALYILNLGYGFEKSGCALHEFQFVSELLGGPGAHDNPGNRFVDSRVATVPVPVPANYLKGIDVARHDFEEPKWSYLRGEHKRGGWWYYYLYAMAVKLPIGTLLLLGLASGMFLYRIRRTLHRPSPISRAALRDDLTLLAPALVLLILVSSQTGFNRYLRYVLPAFPFFYIWSSQFVGGGNRRDTDGANESNRRFLPRWNSRAITIACLSATIASSIASLPHSLSYFNELAGGIKNGPAHLLDANVDWGQDLLELMQWHDAHPECRPLYLAYFGPTDPSITSMDYVPLKPTGLPNHSRTIPISPRPGWYAISVSELHNYGYPPDFRRELVPFRALVPDAYIAGSIRLYRIQRDSTPQMRP